MDDSAIGSFRNSLRSVGVTPVTPFHDDLRKVDEEGLRSNLEYLVERGVTLLYPCGNTGEFTSLSLDEWTVVVEITLEVASGRAVVAPGVGHGFSTAREMLRRAADLGADGALLMPPHPAYLADSGVSAYLSGLADFGALPVVVYKRSGWPTDRTLVDLVGNSPVAGVKYGENDISAFARNVAAADPGLVWTCGIAERYAPFFADAGAGGFTSGLANVAPHLALGLFEALESGDRTESMVLRERCLPFEDIRARDGAANNVGGVKAAMDARGLVGGRVRPPMRDLDAATVQEVREIVTGWFGGFDS
ncbi:MAG: dihydrodipicolinate synthase family protein [Acidimicrobiia bacterium]|nr:dihydrodipicolinate synthase family protein [Acidimicrobiia bacterium]MDH3397925.1 dihydrodipicolinate synthase family protein [Acidimicrobiia bacterium]